MKTKLMLVCTAVLVLILSGCGTDSAKQPSAKTESKTFTYQSEDGPIELPTKPQRIVVLSGFAGNVLKFSDKVVGVDSWSKMNPNFNKQLKNVTEVSEDDLESIIAVKPDLIIALQTVKDKEKLKKIAPTVLYTYGKVPYLEQALEIGKAINQEKAATAWIKDYQTRTKAAGKEVKAHIGENATISILEKFNKQVTVFGDNWGRGSEVVYQEMGLKMPALVKEKALKAGYYTLSNEELGNYMGDYVILSSTNDADSSFQKTASFNEIPAVKNNRIINVESATFYFNDPLTLDFQLKTIKEALLKMN